MLLRRALFDKNCFFSASTWADRANGPLARRHFPKKSAIGLRCYLRAVDKPLDSIAKRGGELDHLLRTGQPGIDFVTSICDRICDARLRSCVSATRVIAARAPTCVFSGQQQFPICTEPVHGVFLQLGSFQEQLAYSRRAETRRQQPGLRADRDRVLFIEADCPCITESAASSGFCGDPFFKCER